MKKATQKKLKFWLITSVVVSLIFGFAVQRNLLNSWHLKLSNFFFAGENNAAEDIVIVAIDNKSFEAKNASELGTLKFDKADYALVFENLNERGTSVIGVDIIFSEISPEADQNRLVEALEKYENIVLAAEPNGLKPLQKFIDPKPENLASIQFKPDIDNTVRRQTILFNDEQAPMAFALKILKKHLGLLPEDSGLTENGYQVMDFTVRLNGQKVPPITLPLNKSDELLVNFFAPPYSFEAISFIDAFNGNMVSRYTGEPIDLTGKIALVGEMGTGIHDVQYVPTSFGTPMPGIEIHANLIQTLLTQKFLTPQPTSQLIILVSLITFVGLLAFLFFSIWQSIALLMAALLGYLFGSFYLFEHGLLLNTVYPYLAIVTAFVASYVYRYFAEARGARETQKAFGKYVSPEVVKKIVNSGGALKLGGHKKTLTVFFSDIVGFTSIAEKTKAETLVSTLNKYLDAIGDIILERHGTLDKFIGDAIVAFWNAPIEVKDHAIQACLTALEAQEAAHKVTPKWKTRIGINTGSVIVGNMGSGKRFDYTAIGDEMNLGARLESANKFYGTSILISESTYKAAKGQIEAREIDLIKVKGKNKPVRIYELQAKKGELKKSQQEINKNFAKGLKAYRDQNWSAAEKAFKACKTDAPAKAYLVRIKELKSAKLPKNWNGVYELKTK